MSFALMSICKDIELKNDTYDDSYDVYDVSDCSYDKDTDSGHDQYEEYHEAIYHE